MRSATFTVIALVSMSAAFPGPARAQVAPAGLQDALWLPWIGCWEGAAGVAPDEDAPPADAFLVCFEPSPGGSGVEILTYSDGELASTEEMIADGTPRPLEEGGCRGEREASGSADGSRVFLGSTMSCAEGVTRTTRGVLSILPGGSGWAEIQSVQAGDQTPVVGIRTFVVASDSLVAAQGARDPSTGVELAVGTARQQASRPLTPPAVAELVDRAGPQVTSSLVAERGERLGLDASTLKALRDGGVPGDVIDVMIATAYPERFAVTGGPEGSPEMRTAAADRGSADGARPPAYRRYPGYSPWSLGFDFYWDPFWSTFYPYGYGFGYDGFGYAPFGYGYGSYGYYPRVIYIQNPTVVNRGSRLSREQGVVRGGSDTGSSSSGAPAPQRSRSGSSSSGSSSSPPPSSISRSSGSSGSSSGGSSGGGGTRQARPR
jgi:hypothetical protein